MDTLIDRLPTDVQPIAVMSLLVMPWVLAILTGFYLLLK